MARHAFTGTYDDDVIRHWLKIFIRRFFNQQFKRSCLPDGPKVGSVCLSPRGDWRMPSDASAQNANHCNDDIYFLKLNTLYIGRIRLYYQPYPFYVL